jgi:hypothetical protein
MRYLILSLETELNLDKSDAEFVWGELSLAGKPAVVDACDA